MALGTLTVQVNALTSNAYANFGNVVIQAYYFCNSKLGSTIGLTSGTVGTDAVTSNDNEGIAVSMLAAALLNNSRLYTKVDGVPRSIDELYTAEIADMLLTPDEADETQMNKGVSWDDSLPTEGWEV